MASGSSARRSGMARPHTWHAVGVQVACRHHGHRSPALQRGSCTSTVLTRPEAGELAAESEQRWLSLVCAQCLPTTCRHATAPPCTMCCNLALDCNLALQGTLPPTFTDFEAMEVLDVFRNVLNGTRRLTALQCA